MDSTYNKLIEAGIKLFGENGYDAVSVRDIVRESGANLSAISYHFGGKTELYKAVVIHLLDELNKMLDKLKPDNFAELSKPEMEQRIREIIIAFHQLVTSKNGKCRLKIYTREATMPDKNLAHQYIANMIRTVHGFFREVLGAYYKKSNQSTDKTEFAIFTLVSILKNIPQQENLPVRLDFEQETIIERLCELIIYGKL